MGNRNEDDYIFEYTPPISIDLSLGFDSCSPVETSANESGRDQGIMVRQTLFCLKEHNQKKSDSQCQRNSAELKQYFPEWVSNLSITSLFISSRTPLRIRSTSI